ncbi:ATP-binding cassette, subfamily B, bacterial [Enterococcus sp. DIV2402]|uniref:ATP-binding cassette, subfamily B, bacterial n=1 Tax=Candidatus Enterococcus lowellii TaxID=2230877 RepID=A0ABZ2SNS3_9ENTE|nr:ABC transporter ATP-binding protein [Enterococcus sp. DIV2402]MBO0463811.1 ABC transporter ATP-binding protein [Enterococcus sp. DIV2402]
MSKFLYNISSGQPKRLFPAVFWATFESIARLIPAVIAFYGINELFESYRAQRALDMRLFLVLGCASIIWFVIQLFISSITYDKEYLTAYDVSAEGRTKLANHLRKLSLGFLDKRDPGDLTTMMLGDYTLVESAVSHMIPQAISAAFLLIIAFFSLLTINWQLTLSLYALLPIVLLVVRGSNHLMKKMGGRHIKAKVDSASRLQEYLQGIKEIKAYSLGGEKFSRIEEAFNRLRKESIKLEGVIGPVVMTAISILRIGLPILIFVGGNLLVNREIDESILLVFIIVASRIYDPFTALMMNYTEMRYATISAERIMDIRNQPVMSGNEELGKDYTIYFENVDFSYNNEKVLHDINLIIQPKTLTALVGPSGSGKSTIVKLIARFYDVQNGQIQIGDKDIKEVKPDNIYSHISMVFQDVYLFKDTLLNNIRVGNQSASFEEIVEAAKKAQCHQFIMSLPSGYDTLVGEGGSTLSGGEKQRISIARAFLKKSEIILLDEATAALDLENESAVQKAITNLVQDKTVIVIAHRLNTVVNADQIIVLNEGRILSQGTHAELYSECSLYKNLVDMQTESKNWKFTKKESIKG